MAIEALDAGSTSVHMEGNKVDMVKPLTPAKRDNACLEAPKTGYEVARRANEVLFGYRMNSVSPESWHNRQ
jgi:hypothetical protein